MIKIKLNSESTSISSLCCVKCVLFDTYTVYVMKIAIMKEKHPMSAHAMPRLIYGLIERLTMSNVSNPVEHYLLYFLYTIF